MSSCVRESSPQPEHAISQKPGKCFIYIKIIKNRTGDILK